MYWENGFYSKQNKDGTRKEISQEKWNELLEGQAKGYEICSDEHGYPYLAEHKPGLDELLNMKKWELKKALISMQENIIQYLVGEKIDNIDELKQKFIATHNELRKLEGKPEREKRYE